MKLFSIAASLCLSVVVVTAVRADAYVGQAADSPAMVPQLSRSVGSPAYIEQMPAGARVRAPAAKRPRAKVASGNTGKGTTVVGKPATKLPAYPSVGSGAATELVAPEIDGFFPSVGRGTISRRQSIGQRPR